MSDVIALHADVQQSSSEFTIFRAPGVETLIVTVDLQCVSTPERLVTTLDATQGIFHTRCDATQQRVAPRIEASLHAGGPPADGHRLSVQQAFCDRR